MMILVILLCLILFIRSLPHHRLLKKASVRFQYARMMNLVEVEGKNPVSGEYDFNLWSRAFKSQLEEFDYVISPDDIDGALPPDLAGTLFRSIPSRFERGGAAYGHYLDGDGYCVRFTFDKVHGVHFRSSFVKTEEYKRESAADSILYRSTFRTQRPQKSDYTFGLFCFNNGLDLKLKNLANTNSVFWGGKLLALFEAGVPHLLDPASLETIGEYDMGLGSELKAGLAVNVPGLKKLFPALHDSIFGAFMTAHPKIDPSIDKLVGWTCRAEMGDSPLDTHPQISIHEWNRDFKRLSPPVTHTLTSTSVAPHDFSITGDYYVFVENRVRGNTLPYVLGTRSPAECVDIEPKEDMILNLVPRRRRQRMATITSAAVIASEKRSDSDKSADASGDRVAFRVPLTPGFTIHSVCAWQEQETRLHLLTTAWESGTVASGQVKGGLLGSWEGRAPNFDSIPITLLYETVVDLSSKKLISHAPFEGMQTTIVEHPHINPNYEGLKPRYVYMSVGSQTGISSPPLGYLRLDLETGEKQQWYAPLHTYCEELVVVPKKKGPPNAAGEECTVWLLASMFDSVRNRSLVGVIDGEAVHKGPISRIWLKNHLPHSLHGCFSYDTFHSF